LGKCAGRQELSQFAAVKEMVPSFGLSRDGKLLAPGEPDQIRIIKVATGQESHLERAGNATWNDVTKWPVPSSAHHTKWPGSSLHVGHDATSPVVFTPGLGATGY
jgi:hypothetical protein